MSSKDWVGNQNSIFKTLGASNHTKEIRPKFDYYATEPKAVELLLEVESFTNVLEPACGEGYMSKVFDENGISVTSSDFVDRGYGTRKNFFDYTIWNGDIVTNPPYKYAYEFVLHALSIVPDGNKVAMFLKLQFLEGKKRKGLFIEQPPKRIYVSSSRLECAKNAEFQRMKNGGGSAVAYAWYVWEKGYSGETIVKWIN